MTASCFVFLIASIAPIAELHDCSGCNNCKCCLIVKSVEGVEAVASRSAVKMLLPLVAVEVACVAAVGFQSGRWHSCPSCRR